MQQITIYYSCPECDVTRRALRVPTRGDDEPLKVWMEVTSRHMQADHHRQSPNCQPTFFTDIMIPMTGADKVGGAPVQ